MSQENPINPEEEVVLGITRADPAFKEIIGKLALAMGLYMVGAEIYPNCSPMLPAPPSFALRTPK
ncbi:MAG: hypothetical protein HXX20_23545 [Chloroflexi bacterium]|nr:hypothetical protein [Chloroflexota bacterium]